MQVTYNGGSTHIGRDTGSIKVTYKDGAVHIPDSDGNPNKENGQKAAECLRTWALLKKPTGDDSTAAERLIESDKIPKDVKHELVENFADSFFSKLDDPSASSGEKAEALIRLIELPREYMTEEQAERLKGILTNGQSDEDSISLDDIYRLAGLIAGVHKKLVSPRTSPEEKAEILRSLLS